MRNTNRYANAIPTGVLPITTPEKKCVKLISAVQLALMPGETLLDITHCMANVWRVMWGRFGNITQRRASLVVTDHRVFIFSKTRHHGYDVQDIAYDSLTAVEWYSTGGPAGGLNTIDLVTKRENERTLVWDVLSGEAARIGPLIRIQMVLRHRHPHARREHGKPRGC
jgi:hypothetical protein